MKQFRMKDGNLNLKLKEPTYLGRFQQFVCQFVSKAVAAGSNFTMALLFNGLAWSGGSSGHSQCELPEELLPEAGDPVAKAIKEAAFGK